MIGVVAVLGTPASALADDTTTIIGNVINGFVRPSYHTLHDGAARMAASMATLCNAPSQDHVVAARRAFSELVDAWSRVEIITVGPIVEHNRLERILYWPDRKGIGLKQVQATLASQDPAATDPRQLAAKSVAMQGLGALEYVLHGAGADDLNRREDRFRCAFGGAVALNLEQVTLQVSVEWDRDDAFAALWLHPGPQNPRFHNSGEAMTELADILITGLERTRDVRAKGFLGTSPENDKPHQGIWWRSGLTGASLSGNLQGLAALYRISRLGDVLPEDLRWINASVSAQLANGAQDAEAFAGPIEDALADPLRRSRLDHLVLVTESLTNLIGTRLTGALNLTAGFSSLDGD